MFAQDHTAMVSSCFFHYLLLLDLVQEAYDPRNALEDRILEYFFNNIYIACKMLIRIYYFIFNAISIAIFNMIAYMDILYSLKYNNTPAINTVELYLYPIQSKYSLTSSLRNIISWEGLTIFDLFSLLEQSSSFITSVRISAFIRLSSPSAFNDSLTAANLNAYIFMFYNHAIDHAVDVFLKKITLYRE